jgi:hypothetical protein
LGHPDGPQNSKELVHAKIRDKKKNLNKFVNEKK